jgi:5-methyltetrahydrofolate--homocysteine methyltransferase
MALPLLERLGRGELLVADGAMGTLLFARGLRQGDCPEAWNLESPGALEEIARSYLDAGADLVQTNTFGGSPLKLAQYGLESKVQEVNRAAVRAVRAAVGDRALVSGSCGPSGKLLLPHGDTEPERVYESFESQMEALIDGGVDLICVETMTDLTEATLAVRAAKAVSAQVPVVATMTFDPTPRGYYTIMGITIESAARGLAEAGADVVGSNCGNGIEKMVEIARELRRHSDLPLIIQSNAGLPELVDGELIYQEAPDFMAEKARELLAAGVSIIGGCCGTTPEHIRAFREVANSEARARR